MPELPEVETICQGLTPYVMGEVIQKVEIRNPNLRWKVASNLAQQVEGQKITATQRRAKYLIWQLEEGQMVWHLGMSGVMRIRPHSFLPEKHDHIDIILPLHRIRFTDPRRFGSLFFTQNWQTHFLLKSLGPEPLSSEFNAEDFAKGLHKSQRPIKLVLMDSHHVVGVGNIYASEALYLAKIHPSLPVTKLTFTQIENLVDAVKATLQQAILEGGTTLKDFAQVNGKPGYFRHKLQVYDKASKPCFICQTPIQKIILGQRSTYFCPACQLL